MVGFQNQRLALTQTLEHMGTCVPQVGHQSQFYIAVAHAHLEWLARVVGNREGCELQFAHFNGFTISGATQLIAVQAPINRLTGQLRALAAPNGFARSQAKLPSMPDMV